METTGTAELYATRRLFAVLSARAASIHTVLERLRQCEMRLECAALVHEVASAVYSSAGYDAYERYETLEEFEQELRPELDAALEAVEVGGVRYYVLRPYFNEHTAIEHLPGSRVHSLMNMFYGRAQFDALAVTPFVAPEPALVAGITSEELQVVAADYRRRTLELVNAMRTLDTALTSSRATLTRKGPEALGVTSEVEALLAELANLVELPGLPPAARWFGTEADKINPLRQLSAEFVQAMTAS